MSPLLLSPCPAPGLSQMGSWQDGVEPAPTDRGSHGQGAGDTQGAWGHVAPWLLMHKVLGDMWPHDSDIHGAWGHMALWTAMHRVPGDMGPMAVMHRVLGTCRVLGDVWPHGSDIQGAGDKQAAWGHMALWTAMHRVLGDTQDAWGHAAHGQPYTRCLGTCGPMDVSAQSAWGHVGPMDIDA